MTRSSPRYLTAEEFRCLERFAVFELSLDQLRSCLRHVMKFDFDAGEHEGKRWMQEKYVSPEPGVLITKRHIEDALTKRRNGEISEGQLVEWATMLLMSHAYELDEKDEDFIAQWLNDISYDLHPFPD